MKVKNEYIIIKNGKNQIKLHNMILNNYLNLITENQLDNSSSRNSLDMYCCYLKFDTSLTVEEDSHIYSSDFDIVFKYENMNIEENQNSISVIYDYNTIPGRFKIFNVSTGDYIRSLDNYIGKKITAIGFGPEYYGDEVELFACVDTNNYNLYLRDILFSIKRKDIFSTDGQFYCPSKLVKSPVHLFSKKPSSVDENTYYFGVLKSVGLGIIANVMAEEHTLLPYASHIISEERKLNIIDELHVSYKDNGLYPDTELYPSNGLWPARRITDILYPELDLYPGETVYPLETPYMYYIYKYEIYKFGPYSIEDTGKYYLISVPINGMERIKSNIKYERAT